MVTMAKSACMSCWKTSSHTWKLFQQSPNRTNVIARQLSFWGSSKVTDWNRAMSEAEKIVGYPSSFMSLRCLLSDELSNVALQMRKLVGTGHPLLKTARKLFYDGNHSMQTRGLLILLLSKAAGPSETSKMNDEVMVSGIYPRQRQLAEITEMIHTANLVHKGVVNLSNIRIADGSPSDMHFGNKMSVLSGDFLLANASTGLAALNNTYVVEIISTAIGNMMEAEFTKLKDKEGQAIIPNGGATMEDWELQTYLSSGSLIANSCQGAMILAEHSEEMKTHAFEFGKQISFARQLSEEIKAFVNPSELTNSISVVTAPVLSFLKLYPNMASEHDLIQNSQIEPQKLRTILKGNKAMDEAKQLCKEYGEKALHALDTFRDSDAKKALQNVTVALTAF